MKLWRKMGNKVTPVEMEKPLTGRQYKYHQAILSSGKADASDLMKALVKRIQYDY